MEAFKTRADTRILAHVCMLEEEEGVCVTFLGRYGLINHVKADRHNPLRGFIFFAVLPSGNIVDEKGFLFVMRLNMVGQMAVVDLVTSQE